MKAKLIKEELSASSALYGFAGWLTTRDEKTVMSSKDDASMAAKLVRDFIEKQGLEDPKPNWEKEIIPMRESRNTSISGYREVVKAIKSSKKLPKEMKEQILKRVISSDYGTSYNKGAVFNLSGSPGKGCSLGADKDGWFVYTHRARSKSKTEISKIPKKDIKFIESTG